MKNPLQRRLNHTYQKLTRDRHTIAKKLKLKDSQYRLWDLYLALYDWDETHTETLETVEGTDRAIASLLEWSPSKVCRVRNALLQKGCLKKISLSTYKVILSKEVAEMQKENAILQHNVSPVQQQIPSMQQNQSYFGQNSIVSYKDRYNFPKKVVLIKQEPRSETEYQRIYDENNYQGLMPDDMRWIDENVKEEIIIENDETEKEIVKIYFNSDWEKYKRHLIFK